ncbi:MAG TPA: undecaprenyldiphospho-muramoylpentapeptide beta-N-acetylglucosaminyltransferase [Acidimicrobiales bacterium]
MTERAFAVIAGGGTAGHVLPGLAVAEALQDRGHDAATLHYVGATRGMEATLVPPAGLPLTLLAVSGFPRRLNLELVRASGRLLGGIVAAWRVLRRLRPRVVVSVGGYASLPAVVVAVLTRVPIVVVSYDARPGRASMLAARFAKACAVAFESSPLRKKLVTGAPLRRDLLAVDRHRDRDEARRALGLPEGRFTLVVVGGSLGSGALNGAVRSFVASHTDRSDLAVHHVVGSRNLDEGWPAHRGPDEIHYQAVGYEGRMPLAYAAADVVLARAGATTVAELAALGVPSILVPWPGAAEDHQSANAAVLGDSGGAVVVPESAFGADRLAKEVDRLLADPVALDRLSAGAAKAGRRDAAEAIADLVEQEARP